MKKLIILAAFAVTIMVAAACKKNEVPPRQEGFINDYTIPPPTFLTDSERAILDAKRDEWDNF